MSLVKNVNRLNRDNHPKSFPSESNIQLKVHWNSNPFNFNPKLNSPDIILNYQFGLFKSEGISDIRNLVSKQKNNMIVLSNEDNRLYVEDEDSGDVDFLAYYLMERG